MIHSESWEAHLEQLRRVLIELRRAGLKANPRKCHLVLTETKYLGYKIGRGLIMPQERNVEAVRMFPRPTNKTQVRALGLLGYYQCFMPSFSSIASPLSDLIKKGQPEKVNWTSEAKQAFQILKKALTSSPVLQAPDFSCPFVLYTDASGTSLLAVLSQTKDGRHTCRS